MFKLPKPQYIKLRNIAQRMISGQYADNGYINFDMISFNGILMCSPDIHVPYFHVPEVLATLAKDLGLMDDGTGTYSYTKPGHEIPELPWLQLMAKGLR